MAAGTRRSLYLAYHKAVRRDRLPQTYRRILKDDEERRGHLALLERLHGVLSHAKRSVPYYRDIMADRGALPDPEGLPEYLASLPILTKDEIRNNSGPLLSEDSARRRTYPNTTGGSTGEPVQFVQDQDYWDLTTAVQMVHAESLGRRLGEREVWIWGLEREVLAGTRERRLRVANRLSRRELFNAYHMRPADIRKLLTGLDAAPPRLIVCSSQAGYEVARFAREKGICIRPQRALVSTAETLHEFMRDELESVFGCAVYNRYGSQEVGDIAGQCVEVGGLHVFPWTVYVEIVDGQGQPVPRGTPGNVLVTSLANLAMPLIRYAIGDRAAMADGVDCACGRCGQMLTELQGRSTDMFRCEDGTIVDYGGLIELLYFRPWVRRFQIVQHEFTRFEFLLETGGMQLPNRQELRTIEDGVSQVMGVECEVSFSFVDAIQTAPSGKYRFTISHVS